MSNEVQDCAQMNGNNACNGIYKGYSLDEFDITNSGMIIPSTNPENMIFDGYSPYSNHTTNSGMIFSGYYYMIFHQLTVL